ncbi:MAG: ABC transporter ATP-binding protein [Ruminococcaceae bacterium]|nr:ABC transporter ATP-binding protein [Oscillospiraceae bacterium]
MTQIKWVFENMKGSKWKFFIGLIFHTGAIIPLLLFSSLLIAEFVDQVFTNGDMSNAYLLIGLYLLVMFLRGAAHHLSNSLFDSASADVLANFRTFLYKKLQTLPPSFFGQNRTGDIMMRLTGDLEIMRHFVSWVMPFALHCVVLFISGLVVFYSTNAILASILLVVSPVMAYLVLKVRKVSAPLHTHLRETNSHLNARVQETIAANRVIKAFVREDHELLRFDKLNDEYRKAAIDSSCVWASKFGPIFGAFGNGVLITVFVVGGLMLVYQQITIGEFLLFYNLNWLVNTSMRQAGIVINDSQRFFSSTQKVMQLYYARCDIQSKENAYVPDENADAPAGKVEFENVSFKYAKTDVLKDITLSAEPGQTIGIMGPTGSGKSTLAMLMARFADVNSGSIKIDGVDVHDYDLNALRKKIGMSMQDVFLFSNTIDANIAYGNPDMSEESVVDYAKSADADSFIKRMPDGYDTIIGERGVGLSGGQKQRIALARALAYETPVLILDDTTSAVDMETEKYIQSQLAIRKGTHTTFIIAQRISSVKNADKIYIIENGSISESGTHDELLKNKGYYYDIYCLQQGIKSEKEEVR